MRIFLILTSIIIFAIFSSPLLAQRHDPDISRPIAEPKDYQESSLRRFEIVFTISIPFTALHSYMAVRGVQMIRQSKIAPSISKGNWNLVGGLTFLYSGFVAFWDYMHIRGKKIETRATPTTDIMPRSFDARPVSLLPSALDIGYAKQSMSREPVLTLFSAKF